MENKNVRIANLDQARQGPSFAPGARPLAGIVDDDDDDEDEFGAGGVDEEDEDFKGAGASSEDSSDNESDAELIPEEGISVEAVGGVHTHTLATSSCRCCGQHHLCVARCTHIIRKYKDFGLYDSDATGGMAERVWRQYQ